MVVTIEVLTDLFLSFSYWVCDYSYHFYGVLFINLFLPYVVWRRRKVPISISHRSFVLTHHPHFLRWKPLQSTKLHFFMVMEYNKISLLFFFFSFCRMYLIVDILNSCVGFNLLILAGGTRRTYIKLDCMIFIV